MLPSLKNTKKVSVGACQPSVTCCIAFNKLSERLHNKIPQITDYLTLFLKRQCQVNTNKLEERIDRRCEQTEAYE